MCSVNAASRWLVIFLGLMSLPARAADCSESEQRRIESRQRNALRELKAGNVAAYRELLRTPDAQMSPACRAEQVRRNPASTICTEQEKSAVLVRYQNMVRLVGPTGSRATLATLGTALDELAALEDEVSSECWTALFYPTDQRVQEACSIGEKNLLAAGATSAISATRHLLSVGDPGPMLDLATSLMSRLSPACYAAASAAGQGGGGTASGGRSQAPGFSNVYDHGGGTFSMTGVGACSPSGCVAF